MVDFVIMCGGMGSRLRPFTYLIPKPFLTANNISPLKYMINNIKKCKQKNKIFVTIFYKKNLIKKNLKKIKSKINIVEEVEARGTAGSLREVIKKTKQKHLILLNGDLFANINFTNLLEFHVKKKNQITACIKKHKIQCPYAVLKKRGQSLFFDEKPNLSVKINAGIYVLKLNFLKKFFKKNKNKFIGMDEILNSGGKLGVFEIGNEWIDIGHISDYKKAYKEISKWK